MSLRHHIKNILAQEDINFLLTNRLPRRWLTQAMGRFSQIKQPQIAAASIAVWKYFSDLDLSEARQQRFDSMHACFTRELKDGMRPVEMNPAMLSSPVDAIVGANGPIAGTTVFQAKGFPYTLQDLLGADADVADWRDGQFVTLRLTSSMYHRFHAPYAGTVDAVQYFSGDTWNVNPIALKRVEKLFCKNERARIDFRLDVGGPMGAQHIALVPIAAILVASIRLHFLDVLMHMGYDGPTKMACDARFAKGQEMGWFQHGSTVVMLVPKGFALAEGLGEGQTVRMGRPLMRWLG